MSTRNRAVTPPPPAGVAVPELPLHRLNLMRVGYLVMGVGLAVVKWPVLLHVVSLPLFEGVVTCLLTALSLRAFLGLRHCALVVVILAVVPWRYVWQHYVTAEGDRWH